MKIAISNIAWTAGEDAAVEVLMHRYGIRGLEVAPTRLWEKPLEASDADVQAFRARVESQGNRIVALQSLLFGRPELVVFGDAATRAETLDYLRGVLRLGARLGAGAAVFGSPKNRRTNGLPSAALRTTALDFFRAVADSAAECGVCFCLEPNPSAYGCDYVLTVADALEVIRTVDRPFFKLNLDTGIMHLNGEAVLPTIEKAMPYIGHLHLSEPNLNVVGSGEVDHLAIRDALCNFGYDGWLSIEMRGGWSNPDALSVEQALQAVTRIYGN